MKWLVALVCGVALAFAPPARADEIEVVDARLSVADQSAACLSSACRRA